MYIKIYDIDDEWNSSLNVFISVCRYVDCIDEYGRKEEKICVKKKGSGKVEEMWCEKKHIERNNEIWDRWQQA